MMRNCIAGRVCAPRISQKPTRTPRGLMSSAEWVGTATDGIGIRGLVRTHSFRATEFSTARSAGASIHRSTSMIRRCSGGATDTATTIITSDAITAPGVRGRTTTEDLTVAATTEMAAMAREDSAEAFTAMGAEFIVAVVSAAATVVHSIAAVVAAAGGTDA